MTPPTRGYTLLRDAALQLAVTEEFAKQWINPRQSAPYDYVASALTTPDEEAFARGPRPGAPLASVKLGDGSYLTDVVSAHFVLLVFGNAAWDAGALSGLTPAVELHRVTDPRSIATYDAVDGTAYLVRPDGHVCGRWKAASIGKVRTALGRAIGKNAEPQRSAT